MEVEFYNEIEDALLKFTVILAKHRGKEEAKKRNIL